MEEGPADVHFGLSLHAQDHFAGLDIDRDVLEPCPRGQLVEALRQGRRNLSLSGAWTIEGDDHLGANRALIRVCRARGVLILVLVLPLPAVGVVAVLPLLAI